MMAGDGLVLVVNAGSSSLKYGLYPAAGPAIWTGHCEGLEPGGRPQARVAERSQALRPSAGESAFQAALAHLARQLAPFQSRLVAVAHRIVHGGEHYRTTCRLDAPAMAALQALAPLAPLHQAHNLAGVVAIQSMWPELPQLGCFDTAFHASLPDVERRLPIARRLAARGLRRYGFHGLSYQFVSDTLRQCTPRHAGRMLLAHLGNGASACATLAGQSVATTMGFSALDGLMMGTRSGSVDAGVLLHLWREGWSLAEVEHLLYRESGLKGVSDLSADMRALRASPQASAREAIELFAHRVRREFGALIGVLGGVDVLAFTGGIGEHDHRLRDEVLSTFGFAGIRLDHRANEAATGDSVRAIHAADSAVEVWVVPTDEGWVAAREAFHWCRTQGAAPV